MDTTMQEATVMSRILLLLSLFVVTSASADQGALDCDRYSRVGDTVELCRDEAFRETGVSLDYRRHVVTNAMLRDTVTRMCRDVKPVMTDCVRNATAACDRQIADVIVAETATFWGVCDGNSPSSWVTAFGDIEEIQPACLDIFRDMCVHMADDIPYDPTPNTTLAEGLSMARSAYNMLYPCVKEHVQDSNGVDPRCPRWEDVLFAVLIKFSINARFGFRPSAEQIQDILTLRGRNSLLQVLQHFY